MLLKPYARSAHREEERDHLVFRIGIREKEKVNIRLEIMKKLNYYLILGKPSGLVVAVKDPQSEQ